MPPRNNQALTLLVPPPVGGLNLTTSIDKLQITEAEHLRGFEFDEYGVLGVPRAPKNLGTIPGNAQVLSGHIFQRANGATQLIVHLADGSLRFSTDFLTTTTVASWTTIATGLDPNVPMYYITWLDAVWMSNGINDFRKWDGTTSTTYPTAPKFRFPAVWRDTLWGAGEIVNPHRVYQSAPGDPTVWPAFNFVDIGKGEGLGITSIFATEASLVVAKHLRTHQIFDPVEYTNRVVDHSKGVLSHSSVVFHNGLLYFASHMGICRYLGDGPSQIVSEKIAPVFDDLYEFGTNLTTQLLDTNREHTIWGYSFENYVGWFLPNNMLSQYIKYCPDLPDKPWLFGTPTEAPSGPIRSVTLAVKEQSKFQQLYRMGGNPAILIREYGGDVGDSILCEWGSAWLDFDVPAEEKYLSHMQILHRGPINVSLKRNYDDDEGRVVVAGLDHGESELQESSVPCDDYAQSFQIFISSSTGGERRQPIGTGLAGVDYVSRFQAGISRVVVKAKSLGAPNQ